MLVALGEVGEDQAAGAGRGGDLAGLAGGEVTVVVGEGGVGVGEGEGVGVGPGCTVSWLLAGQELFQHRLTR